MDTIRVKKSDVIAAVQKNRDAHHGIFLEAMDGYKATALDLLEKHIAEIKAGKVVTVAVHLPQPENHTKDYDRVLKMLEMEVREEIELKEQDVKQYILDDWSWKRAFLSTNSVYSMKAMNLNNSLE